VFFPLFRILIKILGLKKSGVIGITRVRSKHVTSAFPAIVLHSAAGDAHPARIFRQHSVPSKTTEYGIETLA
jgi:hypothetical protein